MAKITHEQLEKELAAKGYTLVDDSNYSNMNSFISIRCEHGHLIQTTLADFRRASFTCPVCDKNISFINPKAVPDKGNAYRIIAFDQATEKFGLSIFDDGKLTFYSLYTFSGDAVHRLVKIKKFIEEIVIQE